MPDTGETLAEFVSRIAELIKVREAELGSYPGDGPTFEEMDKLLTSMERQLKEPRESYTPAVANAVFTDALNVEYSWLFPERDPLAQELIPALRQVQTVMEEVLDQTLPQSIELRQKIVSLTIVANAARRTENLQGNGISWRIVLARVLYWLGGRKRS
jgi:hypothetical protein